MYSFILWVRLPVIFTPPLEFWEEKEIRANLKLFSLPLISALHQGHQDRVYFLVRMNHRTRTGYSATGDYFCMSFAFFFAASNLSHRFCGSVVIFCDQRRLYNSAYGVPGSVQSVRHVLAPASPLTCDKLAPLVPVPCVYCRRPDQARVQARSHSGGSPGKEPQGAQRPVSPWGVQGFATGCHPHPSPA